MTCLESFVANAAETTIRAANAGMSFSQDIYALVLWGFPTDNIDGNISGLPDNTNNININIIIIMMMMMMMITQQQQQLLY